jgi:nucleotide-binding universal stress UspA family protein
MLARGREELVDRRQSMIALKRILVATDFGEAADAALTYGRALACSFGATVHVLHVTENVYVSAFAAESYAASVPALQADVDNAARKRIHELLIDTDGSGPPTRLAVLTSNGPAIAIVEYARDNDIDLIVMGTHGRSGLKHLMMGSVAEHVVRLAACPVLTVRHPEHEFVYADALTTVAHA